MKNKCAGLLLFALVLILCLVSCASTEMEGAAYKKDFYKANFGGYLLFGIHRLHAEEYFKGEGNTLEFCDENDMVITGTITGTGIDFSGEMKNGSVVLDVEMLCRDEHLTVIAKVEEAYILRNGQKLPVPVSMVEERVVEALMKPLADKIEENMNAV